LSIRAKTLKKNDWRIEEARRVLGEYLTKLARFTEAEAILVEVANALQGDYAASKDSKTEAI
jgi:hypothetical protein